MAMNTSKRRIAWINRRPNVRANRWCAIPPRIDRPAIEAAIATLLGYLLTVYEICCEGNRRDDAG